MAIVERELLDFLPLFAEQTEETIRARHQAWVNEGLTPDDVDEWVDVREGGMWWISSAPSIREDARIYDLMGTEFVAAAFPVWTWGEYMDDLAEGVHVERDPATFADGEVTFTIPDGVTIPAGFRVSTEAAEGTDAIEFEVQTAGVGAGGVGVTLAVTAVESGSASNVGSNTVTVPQSSAPDITSLTNADPIQGGTDPETDESLRGKLLAAFEGKGPGTKRDYEIWARSYGHGIGRVTVVPLWDGPGTVLVIALTADGDPVSGATVTGLQEFLDPVPGMAEGLAPVGAVVTAATAVTVDIDVSATVELDAGYSLDGSGGTIAIETAITNAVRAYVEAVPPGEEIVIRKVIARIVEVTGVHDVGSVLLNGAGNNIALDSDPAQVGELDDVTWTEGAVP